MRMEGVPGVRLASAVGCRLFDDVFVRGKILYRGVPMDFVIQEASVLLSLVL